LVSNHRSRHRMGDCYGVGNWEEIKSRIPPNNMKKLIVMVIAIFFSLTLQSHPGRTDSNGGHNDRKHGGYHYHNSGSSGSSVSSTYITPPMTHDEINKVLRQSDPPKIVSPKPVVAKTPEQLQDEKRRLFEFRKEGATNGLPTSQFSLGKMYLSGDGCETNKELGMIWVRLAAANGNTDAQEMVKKWDTKLKAEND
jgi:hypothetical protein